MIMATFIGNKDNLYSSSLPADSYYPELMVADFQQLFQFVEDQPEDSLLFRLEIDRAEVHQQLTILLGQHPNLTERSQQLFGNATTATELYKQAVFSLTAANLIADKMATDATKEAADRQQALSDKERHLRTQSRSAIDKLLTTNAGYTAELI